MNEILVKRIKSFLWRGGMMTLATFLAFAAQNLADLGLPTWLVVSLGLGLGELSKYLNNTSVVSIAQ
jgi:hypothetical protein